MKSYLLVLSFMVVLVNSYAQDTLSGDYGKLHILKGKHIVKSVVNVTDELIVDKDAKVEFINTGAIVCGGTVNIDGENHNIEFYGQKNHEGVGFIFNTSNDKSIYIKNAIFRNLQMPMFFDFGWKRNLVLINENIFTHNIGRVSTIQVLNPPFTYAIDSAYIEFDLSNNLFSDNNASIYFEDLKSEQMNIKINNNVFTNNLVFGSKNYNIATNIFYGRLDQSSSRFTATLSNNSFISNHLVDILTDTIVQQANIGIYGTDKNFSARKNFWGTNDKELIYQSIYDQGKNYNLPRVDVDPILIEPGKGLYTHVYNVRNAKSRSEIADTIPNVNKISTYLLKSNNPIDYSKAVVKYIYLNNDTTVNEVEKVVKFSVTKMDPTTSQVTFTDSIDFKHPNGYFKITNLIDQNNIYVSDVKLGYRKHLLDYYTRKYIQDSLINLRVKDATAKIDSNAADIIKYVEPPFKKHFEFGFTTGGVIFRGTVGNSNLFKSEVNMHNAITVQYHFKSRLSVGVDFAYFKLSGNDFSSSIADQIARGFAFETTMMSVSPSINYEFGESYLYKRKRRFKNVIGIGAEFSQFNPTGTYMGVKYDLQKLGTAGQYLDPAAKPYSLTTAGIFFTYKINFEISKNNTIGFFVAYHSSFTDYLDDVGADLYPNSQALFAKGGAAAVYFSNPTSDAIVAGRKRNFPTSPTDSYIHYGISFTKKILH